MAMHPLTEADIAAFLDQIATHGTMSEAARVAGVPPPTLRHRMAIARARFPHLVEAHNAKMARAAAAVQDRVSTPAPTVDPLPAADLPFAERFDLHTDRNAMRIAHHKAAALQTVRMPIEGPYGIAWLGDPHMDDPFCNLRLLRAHAKIIAETPAMFGANGGDTINNWVGKLERLWAEQNVTATEAWEMVEWLLRGSGINWLVWILGNHDVWNFGQRYFEALNVRRILMRDWDARFNIVSPCGGVCRVWSRHDFKGTSIYNEMHGLKRAVMFEPTADLLAAFHRHTFGYQQTELSTGEVATLVRAKGYKDFDNYSVVNQFHQGTVGHTVVTVIEPRVGQTPIIHGFNDVAKGAVFLRALRAEQGYA